MNIFLQALQESALPDPSTQPSAENFTEKQIQELVSMGFVRAQVLF